MKCSEGSAWHLAMAKLIWVNIIMTHLSNTYYIAGNLHIPFAIFSTFPQSRSHLFLSYRLENIHVRLKQGEIWRLALSLALTRWGNLHLSPKSHRNISGLIFSSRVLTSPPTRGRTISPPLEPKQSFLLLGNPPLKPSCRVARKPKPHQEDTWRCLGQWPQLKNQPQASTNHQGREWVSHLIIPAPSLPPTQLMLCGL